MMIPLFGILFIILAMSYALFSFMTPTREQTVGATYSVVYAEELRINPQEGFLAAMEDLALRHVRVPVYWSRVEKERGEYDFEEIDWIMDQAAAHDAKVTLAIGMKVPRWPECFLPEWASDQSREALKRDVLRLVSTTVERYKAHPALERWQVENEPYFHFGECPKANVERFRAELATVRELDPDHPIVRTTSGEQSLWALHTLGADQLGASLYRVVHNPIIGYVVFPIPPWAYAFQAKLAGLFVDHVMISELQAEPWLIDGHKHLSLKEKYQLFTEVDLQHHLDYAKRTGIPEVSLWGIEWWYHLKQEGDARLWETGKQLINDW
jgi:hypothetical protein